MISDTMNFNSPTCTTIDRNLAKRLSSEYDIDFDAMAKELFGKYGYDSWKRIQEYSLQ